MVASLSVRHAKVSAVADGTNATVVRPSDWNAEHVVSGAQACFAVEDYGAVADGVTDDAAAIQAAIDAASLAGGGIVQLMGGTHLTSIVTLKSDVLLQGHGGATVVKLKAGANTNVIEGLNFQTLTGTDTNSGIQNFGIEDLIVDGNSANNAAPAANKGHGVAFYGRDFFLNNLRIRNCYRRGLHSEYASGSTGTSPFNGNIVDLLTDTTGEEGWYNQVSDSHVTNVNVRSAGVNADNTYDGIQLASHGSIRGNNINVWTGGSTSQRPRYSINVTADGTMITGMHAETGATACIRVSGSFCSLLACFGYNVVGTYTWVVEGNKNVLSGSAQCTSTNTAAIALRIGVGSGNTPSQNVIALTVSGYSAGVADFTNSGGHNLVTIEGNQAGGGVMIVGTPTSSDRPTIRLLSSGIHEINGGRAVGAVAIGDTANALGSDSVAIGNQAIASQSAGVSIGNQTNASGSNATAIGQLCTASAINGTAIGARAVASIVGMWARAAGRIAADGDAQDIMLTWTGQTTDATLTELFVNFPTNTTRAVLANNTVWAFDIRVTGKQTNGTNKFFHRLTGGVISRAANAGSTAVDQAPADTSYLTPSGWACAASADTANGSLKLTVTGAAAMNVNWVAHLYATQITG